jgi:hypothetical protein
MEKEAGGKMHITKMDTERKVHTSLFYKLTCGPSFLCR